MEDLLDIISLYKDHHPSWKDENLKEIFYHIYPSLYFNQFTLNRDDIGEIYGFTNWAFFNKEAEKHFLDNRSVRTEDWQSGDKTWIMNSIYKKEPNAMKFTKTFFTHLLGPGKLIQWLRLASNGLIKTHFKVTTKEHWL